MNGKRWFALLIAVVLAVISLGFRWTTNIATTDFDNMLNSKDKLFAEQVLEEGNKLGNKKIAVLKLEGVIQDTGGSSLLNTSGYDHQRFLQMIEAAGEDRSVDGIILRVNSPGGGVVESAEIHDKIVEVKEETDKPVYVSMGNTAASGGYYVSAPADKIVANAATLTGSIGVIMESINFAELADKYGVDFNTIKSGKYKDIMSPSRKMTDDERDILQTMINDLYGDFVQVIVDGRDMTDEKVRKIGDGRVYTGRQAKDNGLVDDLGTMDDAVAMMEEDYDLEGAKVIQYESDFSFKQLFTVSARSLLVSDPELLGMMDLLRESDTPRAMYLYSR